MKKILLFILLLPTICFAQTQFIGLTGTIIRSATSQTFTNGATGDQAIFSSTIPANSLTVDRPYYFTTDMQLTVPLASLPTISFDVKVGGQTMTFVSSAGLITGVNNALITISGYVVRASDGTVKVKFSISPTSTLSGITLTNSNTATLAVYSSSQIDVTVANAFSVNVAFAGILTGNTTVVRQTYVRSDF